MQALTRNPLADPGLLGVNAGAACAVVIALSLGVAGTSSSVWFAFLGAALASVAVYAIGSAGRGGATPVRLALAGTALTAALTAVIYGVALSDARLLQQFNFWSVGALGGRGRSELDAVVPFVAVGCRDRAGARAVAERARARRRLGPLARGARRPDAHRRAPSRSRCCAAPPPRPPGRSTSSASPSRTPAVRCAAPTSAGSSPTRPCFGAALLLIADVIGRVLVRPSELEAGVMVAVIGAPVFIAIVRRKRIAAL